MRRSGVFWQAERTNVLEHCQQNERASDAVWTRKNRNFASKVHFVPIIKLFREIGAGYKFWQVTYFKKFAYDRFFDEINNDYTFYPCSLFIIRELLDLDLIIRKLIFTSAAFGENCFNFVICKKIKMILRCTEFFGMRCAIALRSDKIIRN